MKRFWAILCVLCLLLSTVPVMSVTAAEAQTYNFTQLAGSYKTQGRVEIVDGALNMDTSSSGFEFYFNGSGNVTMGADVWCKYTNNIFLTIIVDGVAKKLVEVYTGTTANSVYKAITLAENLEEGYHHIEVYKQTEASSGLMTVWGVTFAGTPVTAPPDDKIVMEVVGDSISGGASNLAKNTTANASYPVYQDGTQTYAYFTGEALGANVRVTQTSGYGCCGGWNPGGTSLNLQDMFPYTSYWRDHSDAGLYNFDPPADIVVINLGTNDATAASAGRISLTGEQFKAGAKNLMTMAREKNPGARVVWVTGMMGITYQTELTAAVAELGGAESGYFFTILPEGTSGGEGHPNVAQHKAAADVLTAFLLKNCLPADYKADFTTKETLELTVKNAKAIDAPSAALTEAIAFAQMELDCGTTDEYRLGVRKAAIDKAVNGTVIGMNLMPIENVTVCPVTGDDDSVWPYYGYGNGTATLYKGGEGRFWPYVHTDYEQTVNVNTTPYFTIDTETTAEWNMTVAYLDKNGVRQTVQLMPMTDLGLVDFPAKVERTVYTIDFGAYLKAQDHVAENGIVTIVGFDITVVGEKDTSVHLNMVALTNLAPASSDVPSEITGTYAVNDGLLERLAAGTTAAELIAAMDNAEYLQVADTAADAVLATGMKLQLVVNGNVVDEATVVIRGDVNGDGKANTLDVRAMLAASLTGATDLDAAQKAASDINEDGTVNTVDVRTLLKEFVA